MRAASVFFYRAATVALITLGVLKAAPTFARYRLAASSPEPKATLAG